MQPRAFRIHIRNPLVGAALLVVGVAVVLALLVFGLAILAGLAVVGGVALLVRRLTGRRDTPVRGGARPDPSLEVFGTGGAPTRIPRTSERDAWPDE